MDAPVGRGDRANATGLHQRAPQALERVEPLVLAPAEAGVDAGAAARQHPMARHAGLIVEQGAEPLADSVDPRKRGTTLLEGVLLLTCEAGHRQSGGPQLR
jgi:hypothetical protein